MNKKIYKLSLLLLAVAIILSIWAKAFLPVFMKTAMPCAVYTLTGLYCPGCGGTRAVLSLLHGHFIESFLYHPVVMYTVVILGWYYISNTMEFVTKGRVPVAMKLKVRYLWIALAIILVQCILKNLFQTDGFFIPL